MATLLPNGKQQFFDANGDPLAAGTVTFYIPSTTTFKDTWKDPTQTVVNANPVSLDAGGWAVIYGSGEYRQVVKDVFGNTIWDELTGTSLSSAAIISFDNVPSLLADTTMGYSGAVVVVQAGDVVNAGIYQYVVAPAAATDSDLTTAGGVKLYFVGDVCVPAAFGAAGNGNGAGGGTNDATPLQKMLTAAGARNMGVALARGTIYRCDSGLAVPASVNIEGDSATLDFTNLITGSAMLFANGGSINATIIKGPNPSGALDTASRGVDCLGTYNAGVAPTKVAAPNVTNCTIYNFLGFGVRLQYTYGGQITGNQIHHCGYAGVGGMSCERTSVRGNYIHDIYSTGGTDHYGVFLDRFEVGTETDNPRSYYCDISENVVSAIDWEGIDTHAGIEFTIEGNKVNNCGRGIAVVPSKVGGNFALAAQQCVVRGNIISNPSSTNEGIVVTGAFDGTNTVQYAAGCSIEGNTIIGHGTDGDPDIGAIRCHSTQNINIKGNTLTTSWRTALDLSFNNVAFNVSGNIYNTPQSTVNAAYCIRLSGGNNAGYIGGETFMLSGAPATYYAEYSLYMSAVAGNNVGLGVCAWYGIVPSKLITNYAGNWMGPLWKDRGSAVIPVNAADSSDSVTVNFHQLAPNSNAVVIPVVTVVGPKLGVLRMTTVTTTGFTVTVSTVDGAPWGVAGSVSIAWTAEA